MIARQLHVLVNDFRWIHIAIGLAGNAFFLIGSVLFLPRFDAWQVLAVWMFIAGSALMLLGSLGELLKQVLGPGDGEDAADRDGTVSRAAGSR